MRITDSTRLKVEALGLSKHVGIDPMAFARTDDCAAVSAFLKEASVSIGGDLGPTYLNLMNLVNEAVEAAFIAAGLHFTVRMLFDVMKGGGVRARTAVTGLSARRTERG